MKYLGVSLLLISFNLYAGIELASSAATTELIVERPNAEVHAFEVVNLGDEYEVSILVEGDTSPTVYGCHLHGSEMACHEEGHHHFHKNLNEVAALHAAENAALVRVSRTLARNQQSLEDIIRYKVWRTAETGHAHKSQSHFDYWIKVVTNEREIIQQCHIHAGETEYSCHYRLSGEDEPTF